MAILDDPRFKYQDRVKSGTTGFKVNVDDVEKRWQQFQKKQQKQEKKITQVIDQGLNRGMSWEDIAKQTGIPLAEVQSYSQRTRPEYGIAKQPSLLQRAGGAAKAVGQGIAQSYDILSKGTAEVLGGSAQARANEAQARADQASTDLIRRATQQLQDPNVPAERKAQLREAIKKVSGTTTEAFGTQQARLKEIQERTDPVRGAAAVGSIGFDVLTAGTVGGAARAGAAGLGRRVASGAAQGAVSGGLGAVETQGRDVSARDIARGAAAGAVVGGGLTALSAKIGQLVADRKISRETAAKVLGDAQEGRGVIQVVNNTTGTKRYIQPTDVEYEDALLRIDNARVANGQADEGIAGVRQPGGDVYHITSKTPAQMEAAGFTRSTEAIPSSQAQAVVPSPAMAETVAPPTRVQQLPGESVPMAAQRLEADALKADLAPEGGFNIPATTNMKMEDQINKAIVLMDNDFDTATKVAMGKVNAPADLQSSVVFEAVKQRAIKNKDKALLYELSKSDVPSQGKAAGQFIKGFDTKNAEDPVAVMQRITKARKDSKIPGINKDLTMDEVTTITDMSDDLISKKAAMADTPVGSKERLAYGQARVAYDNYVNELEAATKKRSLKDRIVRHPADSLNELAGSIKGIQAALDNSAIFRQGWKTMWTNPTMWAKNAARTFKDIKGGFQNKNMIDALKADIVSRPNFELYKKAKLAVVDIAEEAFPSTLPERIPALGRAFKASEYAYTGFLQRQRADVFDKLLNVAKAQGRDITDKKELEAIGNYVNTLTGRANLGKAEPAAKYFNNIFFSPRNFWANVQTLTGNQLQQGVTPFVRQQAALNLLKIIGGTASVLATANFLKPGSVEWDPRSSDFGKIKIGNTRFDASGGMSSLVTIASRLLPTKHGDEWGNFKKSSTTGMMQQYNTGKPGDQTTWDAFLDFGEGKLSPAVQVVKQLITGEDFIGDKVTPAQAALNAIIPIPIKNFQELQKDPNSANTLMAMIADGLGIGTNTYGSQKDWNKSDSKRVTQFKESVDETQFIEANARYNERLKAWLENVQKDSAFGKKPIVEQQSLINAKRNKLMSDVMKEYGFQYKQDRSNKDENERLMGL